LTPRTLLDWITADFARRLLLERGVAVLPGVALREAGEGFFRIALTVPEERIREATERIGRVLDSTVG
jgi:LL-diaminopimelate aminotransferase